MKKITYLTYAALFALTSCTNEINEEGFVAVSYTHLTLPTIVPV